MDDTLVRIFLFLLLFFFFFLLFIFFGVTFLKCHTYLRSVLSRMSLEYPLSSSHRVVLCSQCILRVCISTYYTMQTSIDSFHFTVITLTRSDAFESLLVSNILMALVIVDFRNYYPYSYSFCFSHRREPKNIYHADSSGDKKLLKINRRTSEAYITSHEIRL